MCPDKRLNRSTPSTIHTGEYYITWKDVLTHAALWMDLEHIFTLIEASHKRTNAELSHLSETPTVIRFTETGSKWWLPGTREGMGVTV